MAELLCIGEVYDAAGPNAAGAKLYQSSDGYGMATGTNKYLSYQTQEWAPSGPSGRQMFRRLYLMLGYDNTVTVQVSATVDFTNVIPAQSRTLPAPSAYTMIPLEFAIAAVGTYIVSTVQITSVAGRVSFLGMRVGLLPLGVGAATVGAAEA